MLPVGRPSPFNAPQFTPCNHIYTFITPNHISGAYLAVLLASVCKNFNDVKRKICTQLPTFVFGQTFWWFFIYFSSKTVLNRRKDLMETDAFHSTWRPRHCSSSCLWHACACTHTHTYTYTNRRTALQRAQDGAWATKHHSVRPPLTMIEIFFGAIRVARYHEELHWNNTYYQIGWISLELPKNGTATQHREVQRNKCYPDKLRR